MTKRKDEKGEVVGNKTIGNSRFDWNLILILFLFFCTSIIAIASAQIGDNDPTNYVVKQIVFYIIGVIIIALAIRIDPEQYQRLTWFFYGFGIFLLFFILVAPDALLSKSYPKSWFSIPGIGFSLQPSEFMKTFLILALSKVVVKHRNTVTHSSTKTDFLLLAKMSLITLIPMALVLRQPDLGTSLVFIAIFVGLVFVSGITWKIIVPTFLSITIIGVTFLGLILYNPEFLEEKFDLDQYQFDRVYTWLDPYNNKQNEGYNLIQAMTAIGYGQLQGNGFSHNTVYVPERHTDFIFTTIGEDFGFIGSSIVIILFFLLIYRLIKIAVLVKDPFSTFVIAGIISMITFHVFENIGMSIQVLPITGIPLPFISYGGSSLMGTMLAMGVVFSIRSHYKKYLFSSD